MSVQPPVPLSGPHAHVRNTPLVLIIRDGWGENPHPEHDAFNAVKLAKTPVDDALRRDWPWTLLKTSGEDVGLPEGTMGNSEVGHQNIGAGRIVDQESVAITKACRAGLESNHTLVEAVTNAKIKGRCVHVMGIASDAGVHGLLSHLYAIIKLCKKLDHPNVALHLFTDGRDTGPFTGLGFIRAIEESVRAIGFSDGRSIIASVMGRYWAMDRDFRWERVDRAFRCMTGIGASDIRIPTAPSAEAAVQAFYDQATAENMQGDEFVTPTMIAASPAEAARTRIADGDTVIFYNYRGDRPREIVSAFVLPDTEWMKVKPSPDTQISGFDRGRKLDLNFVTMTAYSEALAPYVRVAFPKPPKMVNIAGEYLSSLGLRQFRCAETEKYPHVTFFFNDYRDPPFPGETRENPQSPKVATYDLQPEMSADKVRDAVLRRLAAGDCEDFLVVNFANGDMVGHTGNLEAAIKACETVDRCVGAIMSATLKRGGSLIIAADHGNAEQMFDPATGSPHTAHTTYDVPLFVVGEAFKGRRLYGDKLASNWTNAIAREQRGRLADIVPTALDMMGLPKPVEMDGQSLLL
jgi:2,3-bisphosphoglycerate-independent phosphoglycerate mutase